MTIALTKRNGIIIRNDLFAIDPLCVQMRKKVWHTNNDWTEFPTYDATNAALNWQFLATQSITPENFTTTFRPWTIALQKDSVDSPSGERVSAEWNMFGTHGVSFVPYEDLNGSLFSTTKNRKGER